MLTPAQGRAGRIGALLAATAICLSACTGVPAPAADGTAPAGGTGAAAPVSTGPPTPGQWRRDVPMEPLAVPAEMVATADRLDGGDLVAGTSGLPAISAVIRTSPDGRRHLRVLRWDGSAWQPADIGPGVPGEPQLTLLAGNEQVAAIAGWTWEAGTIWPYLLTSTDRIGWTPVQLPESLNAASISAVAVDGGRIVALTEGDDGAAATIVVDGAGRGEPVVTPLPARREGERRALTGLAVAGDTVVLTGREGPDDRGPLLAFRSPDAGGTWAEPVVVSPNDEAWASGVAEVPTGFVITGNDLIPDDPGGHVRMAAWSSPDGITWNAESVPEPDHFRWDGHHASLGVPTTAGDYVVAVGGSTNSRSSRLFQRQPGGDWIAVAQTNQVADAVGRLGHVAPIEQPSGSNAPGALLVTIGGAHGTVVGRIASGVWTSDVTPLVDRDPPTFDGLVTGRLAVVRQRQFLPFGNGGFRTVQEPTLIGLDGDAFSVLPWDPPEAADAEDVEIGVAGTAQVVLSSRLSDDEEKEPISGWFRPAPGRPWQPVTGFGVDASESLGEISHLGGRWILRGSHADDTGGTDQAMLWTSADGIGWSRADGDFADGDRSSGIGEVCLDAAGRTVAVGWIRLTESTPTAAMWTEQDGRWQRTTLPTGPEDSSAFHTCGTVAGQLVIGGKRNGAAQRWTADAAGAVQPIDPPVVDAPTQPRGDAAEPFSVDDTGKAPGGYMAVGRLDTAEYTGTVLWLSADGARWTWVPVPTADPDASLMARTDGADLIVLSSSTNFSQAWRIPDIGSVIASIPPTA